MDDQSKIHEPPPGWKGNVEGFNNGVKFLAKVMRPSEEVYEYYTTLRKDVCGAIIQENSVWFLANCDPADKEGKFTQFTKAVEIADAVLAKWTAKVLSSPDFMRPDLLLPMSESFELVKALMMGDGGLENAIREAIVDNNWRNTPIAELVAATALIGAYPTLIGIKKVCWYLANCREHLIWMFHNPGDTSPPTQTNA